MHTSLKLSSDTIVLIDGFVNKHFTNKTNEQIQEIKQEAIKLYTLLQRKVAKRKNLYKSN